MREMQEYTAELHRRIDETLEQRRQTRRRAAGLCVPLALVLVICTAAALPRLLDRSGREPAAPGPDSVIAGGTAAAEGKDEKLPESAERKEYAVQRSEELQYEGIIGSDAIPSDFSFRFVWGCYGISSYDSESGELVKTSDATRPEDYITKHELTEAERSEVWALLSGLGLEDYPAVYDPYNDPNSDQLVASEPNRDLVLSLRAEGIETTVSCRKICLGGVVGGYDAKARAFLAACDRLQQLLTGTPEWQALPDYEFYYE